MTRPPAATTALMPRPLTGAQGGVLLLTLVLLAALLAPLSAAPRAGERTFLVPAGELLPIGTRVLQALPIADALLVSGTRAPAGAIDAATSLTFRSLDLEPAEDSLPLDSGVRSTGADLVWENENKGEGSVVALIDSGVAPIAALDGAVVGEIDFTGSGGGDGFGHGTFMASLIAGRGPIAPGVAPGASILSLKVGDAEGGTTLGAVIDALQWLDGPGRQGGVRIASLALGIDADTPAARLLDRAVDRLASGDVLVITAAGNEGPGVLTSPATATTSFSLGAFDDQNPGSSPTPAHFSGSGLDRNRVAQPDALASGVRLAGHIDPTSVLGQQNSDRLDDTLLHGTGTSMSTALAAGVAALVQTARPEAGGAALDIALRNDAGVIDAPDAVQAILEAPDQPTAAPSPGRGNGRGNANANGKAGAGPAAPLPGGSDGGAVWDGFRWTNVHWTGFRWTGFRWTGFRWTGFRWTALKWNGAGWGDATWAGAALGGAQWNGFRWTGFRWTGFRWTGDRWEGSGTDGGSAFTGFRWTGFRWTGFRWTLYDAG